MDNFDKNKPNFEIKDKIFESSFEKDMKKTNDSFSSKNEFKSDKDNVEQDDETIDIKKIIEDLDQTININIRRINYDEYDRYINHIKLSLYDDNYNCQKELLNILEKPLSNKNMRNKPLIFKPLLKSKKVSLIGKVFGDIPSNDTSQNTINKNTETNNY